MSFVIEKGVPMPAWSTKHEGPPKTAAFRAMEVGDSFLLPDCEPTDKNVMSWRQVARNVGSKAAVRKEGTGVRIWRVA